MEQLLLGQLHSQSGFARLVPSSVPAARLQCKEENGWMHIPSFPSPVAHTGASRLEQERAEEAAIASFGLFHYMGRTQNKPG